MCACEVTAGHSKSILLSGRENGKCNGEVHRPRLPAQALRTYGNTTIELEHALQLYADKLAGIASGSRWLNLPEYITYLLAADRVRVYERYAHASW